MIDVSTADAGGVVACSHCRRRYRVVVRARPVPQPPLVRALDDEPDYVDLPGPGEFALQIVGESHYQSALAEICGGKCWQGVEQYVTATLVLEDSNPYDDKAVRVDINGRTVGYLARKAAREYREELRKGGFPHMNGKCQAVIRGGWYRSGGDDTGQFGVRLDLPTNDRAVARAKRRQAKERRDRGSD